MTFNDLIRGGAPLSREWASDGRALAQLVANAHDGQERSLAKAREIVREFSANDSPVVDSLIADRRAENAKDEAESAAWYAKRAGIPDRE